MGTLSEDLTAIKTVEDTLNGNKVARFSYTETAYCCNCANGVTEYDVDRENNIPVGNASIMKLNETILSKGWRAQASAITRMAMNHFLGLLSYNVNKLTDNLTGLLNTLVSHVGSANGLATLDANGRIPYSQLPESAMEYKGSWNANLNEPQLADGMSGADKGDFYVVSVAGTQNLGSGNIQFFVNDRVIYNGALWQRLSAGDVKSVNNVTPVNGNITLTKSDIGLSNVDNTADANKTVACACCAVNASNADCAVNACNAGYADEADSANLAKLSTEVSLNRTTNNSIQFYSCVCTSFTPQYILGITSCGSGVAQAKFIETCSMCIGNAQFAQEAHIADEATLWTASNVDEVRLRHLISCCACTESTMLLGIACGDNIGTYADVCGFYTCDLSVNYANQAKEACASCWAKSVAPMTKVHYVYNYCCSGQSGNTFAVCACADSAGVYVILDRDYYPSNIDTVAQIVNIPQSCTWVCLGEIGCTCSSIPSASYQALHVDTY